MLSYFQRVGDRIEQAWLSRSYNEEIFPQLVLYELERDPPFGQVGVTDIIDWVFSSNQEFRQPSNHDLFGEPPVMLFQAPRFYIEALFWLSGTTEIHEHGFSGAFAVLAGSSVHSHWRFSPERTINSRMLCGRLERIETEILHVGSMRPIHSGDRLIHQLFHLEVPSVTVVVRTYVDRDHLPQFNYLPPGLAIDPEGHDSLRKRRLVLLEAMAGGRINGLREYARRIVETGDLESLYYTFSALTRRKVDRELLSELYAVALQRHGAIVQIFQQVCEGERRTRIVTSLRSKIENPEARFLLALLMLMPERNAILETIRLQFPELEPVDAIETWVESMNKETIGFEFNDLNRRIFRVLIEGLNTEGLLQRLQAECLGDSIDEHRDRLLKHAKLIAKSALFYPLFSNSPLREEVNMT